MMRTRLTYVPLEVADQFEDFIIERDPDTLWFSWHSLAEDDEKKISPRKVREMISQMGEDVMQSELMKDLIELASKPTALEAIKAAERAGYIEVEELPGRGKPKRLKLKE